MAVVVDPGTPSTLDQPGKPPSDATVLFDGTDASAWVAMDGSPTKWIVHNGAFECVPGSGYARTLQAFGDCQLHVEWAAPNPPHGASQGRGNSGVFFGFDRYEVQVLDSYQSKTYADGAAAAVYGQYPPLVNVCRPPGVWQTYDIIWTAPRFDDDGKLVSKARETVIHNGVLVQNNVELTGPTGWIGRIPYDAHPLRTPSPSRTTATRCATAMSGSASSGPFATRNTASPTPYSTPTWAPMSAARAMPRSSASRTACSR
jgi:hypothetical protein